MNSYVLASDNLMHTKETVIPCMSKLLSIVTNDSEVDSVHIFSDGPTSQFKNQYVFIWLAVSSRVFGVKIQWHFFATSHGKGPVDGIGGTVKRVVENRVRIRSAIVQNAHSFVRVANEHTEKIQVIEMTQADIDQNAKNMDLSELWSSVPSISKILGIHFCRVISESSVECKSTSRDPTNHVYAFCGRKVDEAMETESPPALYSPGAFVKIAYPLKRKNRNFVGQILVVDDDMLKIHFFAGDN